MSGRKITTDHRATLVLVFIQHCQGSRPVLTGGEIALRCCIDSPSGCFNVLSAQGARLAIHVSLPTRGDARNFFLPFDGLLFALYHFTRSHTPWCGLLLPPFTVSHDLTHLGRKVREHIPLKKISHTLGTRTGQYYGISY